MKKAIVLSYMISSVCIVNGMNMPVDSEMGLKGGKQEAPQQRSINHASPRMDQSEEGVNSKRPDLQQGNKREIRAERRLP